MLKNRKPSRYVIIAAILFALAAATVTATQGAQFAFIDSVTQLLGIAPNSQIALKAPTPTASLRRFDNLTESMFARPMQPRFFADTVVTVGGGATVACPATPTATFTTSPTGVTFTNWSRGSGVTCGTAADGLSGSGFNTADAATSFAANKFYKITISADATHTFTLKSINWLGTISSGTGTFTIKTSNNGGTATDFGIATSGVTGSAISSTFTGSVVVAAGTTVDVYLIPSNLTAGTTTARFKNNSTITVDATTAGLSNQVTLAVNDPGTVTFGTTPQLTTSGGSGTGTVTFSHGTSTGCTVTSAGVLSVTNATGTCSVTSTKAGDATFNPTTSVARTITLAKASQTITVTSTAPSNATVGGSTYSVTATSTSGLAVSIASTTTSVCAGSGTSPVTITFVGAGSCVLSATQVGSNNYSSAIAAGQTFSVAAAAHTVIFNGNGSTSGTMANQTANTPTNLTANAFVRTGYTFAGWGTSAGGPVVYADQATYPFATDATLFAQWSANSYQLTVNSDGNGSTTPAGTSSVNYGVATAISATPDAAYHFVNWTVPTGAATFGDANAASTTVTLTSGNATIQANFAITGYTITATAPTNGTITPAGVTNVNSGGSQIYTITPNPGYKVTDVAVDGGSIGAVTAYSFSNVTANHTIAATFAINDVSTGVSGDLTAGSYNNVTVNSPAVVTLTGDVEITGCLNVNSGATVIAGTQIISGGGCVNINDGATFSTGNANGVFDSTNPGTVETTTHTFSPNATYVFNGTADQKVGDGLPATVANLTITNSGENGPTPAQNNTVTGNPGQIVTNTLTVNDGVYQSHSDYADVVINAAGTLNLTGPTTVSGNWTNDGGTLTGNFTVTFDGDGVIPQTIAGNTTFYGFNKTVSSAQTVRFTAGSTTTVTNSLTLVGAVGQPLSLRSTTDGTQWVINPTGTRSVSYTDVKDSNNTNPTAISTSNSTDSGNNLNWNFPSATCHTLTSGTQNTYKGAAITVPVSVSSTTGDGLLSADFKVTYNTSVISAAHTAGAFVSASAGTVDPGAIVTVSEITPGVLEVSIASSTPFAGAGTLANINFTAIGDAPSSTSLTLSDGGFGNPDTGILCANYTNGSVSIATRATTTSVMTSASPSTFGGGVTFTATVATTPVTPAVSGGSVTFYDGGTDCSAHGPALGSAVNLTGNSAAFTTSALTVGAHTVVACYSGSTNFDASSGTVAQQVGQATQTITFAPLGNKAYGDAPFDVSATGGASGNPVTFTVGGNCTNSGTNGEHISITGAGSCTVTAHQAGNASYSPAADVPQTFSIAKATLTVTPDAKTITYGTADPTFTFTYSGFVNGDSSTDLITQASCSVTGNSPHAVGTYPITCTAGTAANYNFNVTATANFTVTKKTLTVTPDVQTVTYGSADPAFTFTYSGFITGESSADLTTQASCSVTGTSPHPVGTYTIACTAGTAANYDFNVTPTANFTVTPATLSVNAVAASKAYGATDPATFTNTITGYVNGENASTAGVAGTASCTRTAGETAGTYTITCTAGSLAAANYTFVTGTTAVFTINALHITGTFTASDKIYDGNNSATVASRSLIGVIGSDDVTLTGGTATFANANVGTAKPVTLTGATLTGAAASNYVLDSVANTTANITKADAVCSVTSYNVPYDGLEHMATGSCHGVLGVGEDLSSGLDLTNTKHTNPGTFSGDYWTFASPNGNYNDITAHQLITDVITSGSLTGTVTNTIANKLVSGAVVTATNGITPLSGTTIANGTYSINGFGIGNYTFSAAKTKQACLANNGITADDAALVSQYVVHLANFSADQQAAAHVSSVTANISSLDAALIAQKAVNACNANNRSGEWVFNTGSLSQPTTVTTAKVDDFTTYMMGDVDGDWSPSGANRQAKSENLTSSPNAVIASVPQLTANSGTQVTVPFRIDNLGGKTVRSTQFSIEYDPSVLEPVAGSASVQGTNASTLGVVSNAPVAGLLKVAVYGAVPVGGDGVYVNMTFTVRGSVGSSTPLTVSGFRFNANTDEVTSTNGHFTVSPQSAGGSLQGRVLTVDGRGVTNAAVNVVSSGGTVRQTITTRDGQFSISGLTTGETYTVTVASRRFSFGSRTVSLTDNVVNLDIIAEQ